MHGTACRPNQRINPREVTPGISGTKKIAPVQVLIGAGGEWEPHDRKREIERIEQ